MRLIDADEAYKVLTDYYHTRTPIQQLALKEALARVPTIDVEPIRHGKWISHGSYFTCSVCGEEQFGIDTGRYYCQNCGAKMEGEE